MAIALPDPTPSFEPMCSIDGEVMTVAEWEYRITPKHGRETRSRRDEPAHSNPDGVLAAIDACLSDYSVSPDAMRCAPDVEANPVRSSVRWDERGGEILSWPLTTPHPAEWQYTTVGTDPVVVEVRRYGQPWGAYLLSSLPPAPAVPEENR